MGPSKEFSPSLIDQKLRAALRIGEELQSFTYVVTANDVQDFLIATGEADDQSNGSPTVDGLLEPGEPTPLTFFAALDPIERRDLAMPDYLSAIPYEQTSGGNANAFNEVRYERPFVVGDIITVRTRFTEVYEREGRNGRLLFRVRESRFYDTDNDLVATTRGGHVCTFDLSKPKGANR